MSPSVVAHTAADGLDPYAAARRVLADPPSSFGSGWAVAVCLLARQALEESLNRFWTAKDPQVTDTSFAHQLICLESLVPDAVGLYSMWSRLSGWCHYSGSLSDPSGPELDALLTELHVHLQVLAEAHA